MLYVILGDINEDVKAERMVLILPCTLLCVFVPTIVEKLLIWNWCNLVGICVVPQKSLGSVTFDFDFWSSDLFSHFWIRELHTVWKLLVRFDAITLYCIAVVKIRFYLLIWMAACSVCAANCCVCVQTHYLICKVFFIWSMNARLLEDMHFGCSW